MHYLPKIQMMWYDNFVNIVLDYYIQCMLSLYKKVRINEWFHVTLQKMHKKKNSLYLGNI